MRQNDWILGKGLTMAAPRLLAGNYQYTATVLAMQASVSMGESGTTASHCDLLIMNSFDKRPEYFRL